MTDENQIELNKISDEIKHDIKTLLEVVEPVRIHMVGGATKVELMKRTGWNSAVIDKFIHKAFKYNLISNINEKYFLNLESKKIIEKTIQKTALLNHLIFEQNIIQEYFTPSEPLKSIGASKKENDLPN
jgi:galactokinase/mevalonate kinase-like predicted kinase